MPQPLRHSADHTFLSDLADSLGRAVADNGGAALVHVASSDHGPDVGILPLGDLAPAEALLGAVAPAHWAALGIATRARARPLGGKGSAGPATVVVLVPQRGEIVSRVRQGDRVFPEPPSSGVTLDCLQRALRLPTAPPDVPATHLLAITWVERVLDESERRRLAWDEMRALHPACDVPGASSAGDAADLPRLPAELEEMFEWGRLRRLVIEGKWPEPNLTPAEAEWFDEGGFSRWVLSRRPSLHVLLDELPAVVGPAGARRCTQALRRAGMNTAA
ncbi:MAG: hypothetical protein M3203_16870 [Actinomycetota bacterium]|nr:hypothetical protein [Actinomycetota bacterium]